MRFTAFVLVIVIALAACTSAGVLSTTPLFNASYVPSGFAVNLTTPACAGAVTGRACNAMCLDAAQCVSSHRWSSVSGDLTDGGIWCAFAFTCPAGEAAGAYNLAAQIMCIE